jgi:hypothetical protein
MYLITIFLLKSLAFKEWKNFVKKDGDKTWVENSVCCGEERP